MNRILLNFLLFLAATNPVMARELDPTFYANAPFHRQFPGATALTPESKKFITRSFANTFTDAQELVSKIRSTPSLDQAILNFPKLSEADRIQVMKTLFQLEVQTLKITPPELILDSTAKKSTFFDFDPAHPNAGKVILNPSKLFSDANPHAALLFLVHETRHSFQFQAGFQPTAKTPIELVQGYHAGFLAQKAVFEQKIKVSFCDFLTLNQEYEAFLYGNIVMQMLGKGKIKTSDMGTLASQYVHPTGVRLNLPKLIRAGGTQNLIDRFNELEIVQYRERH